MSCIYCKFHTQDTKHLLWECNTVKTLWQKVSQIINLDVNWQHIVLGVNGNRQANLVISVVSFLIYKKFQQEKLLLNGFQDTSNYMIPEIQYKALLYFKIKSVQHVAPTLNELSNTL